MIPKTINIPQAPEIRVIP